MPSQSASSLRRKKVKAHFWPLGLSSGPTVPGTSHSPFLILQLTWPMKDQRAELALFPLTYVPIEDGDQHIQSPFQPHEPQAEEHNQLQNWTPSRPQVATQEAELPAKVSPCRSWWCLC